MGKEEYIKYQKAFREWQEASRPIVNLLINIAMMEVASYILHDDGTLEVKHQEGLCDVRTKKRNGFDGLM